MSELLYDEIKKTFFFKTLRNKSHKLFMYVAQTQERIIPKI